MVDDEVDLLQTYERLLRRVGYEVIAAQRGQEGLSIAQLNQVAPVIVDLKLPEWTALLWSELSAPGPTHRSSSSSPGSRRRRLGRLRSKPEPLAISRSLFPYWH